MYHDIPMVETRMPPADPDYDMYDEGYTDYQGYDQDPYEEQYSQPPQFDETVL